MNTKHSISLWINRLKKTACSAIFFTLILFIYPAEIKKDLNTPDTRSGLGLLLSKATPAPLLPITRVERDFPKIPQNFSMRDWKKTALNFDKVAFDPDFKGPYGPVFWWDDTKVHYPKKTFGIDTYLGDPRMGPPDQMYSAEGITCISAVLGSSLVGVDKSNQKGENFVEMLGGYFSPKRKIMIDSRLGSEGSHWYDLLPNILYAYVADLYPKVSNVDELLKSSTQQWMKANRIMDGNYWNTSFNFGEMKISDHTMNWVEPDSAAGIAFMMMVGHYKFGNAEYLEECRRAFDFMEEEKSNIYYEILMPYGVYTAARMNAEQGTSYNVAKYANWSISSTSACRVTFGVEARAYGDCDFHGLIGDVKSGYVFAMNTFSYAIPLIPALRYEPGLAKSIGRWFLHAAHNCKYFYPDELSEEMQSDPEIKGQYLDTIGYEGVKMSENGQSPYATGDPKQHHWGPSNLSLYGSTHVGVFGGIIEKTNIPEVLKVDCLKTDLFSKKPFPVFLYYNPLDQVAVIDANFGNSNYHLYDLISKKILASNIKGKTTFKISPDQAVVLTVLPADGKYEVRGKYLMVNGEIADHTLLRK